MPGTELRVAMKKKSKVLAFRREGVRSSIDSSMLQEFVVEKSVYRTSESIPGQNALSLSDRECRFGWSILAPQFSTGFSA